MKKPAVFLLVFLLIFAPFASQAFALSEEQNFAVVEASDPVTDESSQPDQPVSEPKEKSDELDEPAEPADQGPPVALTEEPYSPDRSPANKIPLLETDSNTGALTFSYPLALPPGRNGLQPELAIKYSSQAHSSVPENILGAGWSLSIPYIERVNRTGIENLYTNNIFSSSLSGELASSSLIDATHGIYGTRDEQGDFLKYEYNTDESWRVTRKDGRVYSFGTSTTTQVVNPSDNTKVFRWMLAEIRDPNGNYITYTYTKDLNQVYPDAITYTHSDPIPNGIFEISFTKTDGRVDKRIMYNAGFRVETAYYISEIQIKENGSWVRKYTMAYVVGSGSAVDPLRLASITESGRDDQGNVTSRPAITFSYPENFGGAGMPGWANVGTAYAIPVMTDYVTSQEDTGARVSDINGDGYDDLINGRPITEVYFNDTDDTGWDSLDLTESRFSFASNGGLDTGTRLADFNADHLPDIMDSTGAVFLNQNGQGWASQNALDFWTVNPYFARTFADVNGDGLLDVLYGLDQDPNSGTYLNRGPYNGNGFEKATTTFALPMNFSNAYNQFTGLVAMDVNADGLADLARKICSALCDEVYINTGSGWTLTSDFLPPPNWTTNLWQPDVNNDGITDAYSDLTGYYNGGIRGWGRLNPPVNLQSYYRIVDANGDGYQDFIRKSYQVHETQIADGRYKFLNGVNFHQGGSQQVIYKIGTRYKDSSGNLLNPKLGTAVPTVYQIGSNDGLGASATTTFEYADGEYYYGGPFDRKFAGFGEIKKTDPAGNVTKTFYHQGNASATSTGEYDDHVSKIGKPYRVEQYDNAGNLYRKTINKWDRTDLGNERSFVKLAQSLDFAYDGDSDHKDKAESFTYDNTHGSPTEQIAWGEVSGSDDGTFTDTGSDKFTTSISYAASSTALLVLPSQETATDQGAAKVKESNYYYDGLSLGSVNKGNLTKEERWKTGSSYIDIEKTYNSYGLVTQEKDPRDKTTSFTYDANNLYPATVTNPAGHIASYTYDYSSGQIKDTTDPNLNVFQNTYDGLDRLLSKKQPNVAATSTLETLQSFVYTDTAGSVSVKKSDHLDGSNVVDTYSYLDGLGRMIQTRKEAEDSGVFSARDMAYNSRGEVSKESLPYFSSGSGKTTATTTANLFTNYEYDPLLRISSTSNAVASSTNAYDDWKMTATDPNGNVKHLYKDAYDNLVKVEEINATSTYATVYEYNGNRNLTKITDALGNIRNFTYDGLGRRLTAQDLHAASDPTYGAWTYTYDDAGNLTQSVDPKSQTVDFSFDDINRVLTENYTGLAGIEVAYSYDLCTQGKGRLCTASSTAVLVSNVYNALGQIAQETKTVDSTNYQTSYIYDRQGNLLTITNPDSSQVSYTYNAAGLPETIANIVTDFDYGPHEKLTYQANANSTATTNTYDQDKIWRLASKLTTVSGGSKGQDLAYTYDPVGNISRIVDASSTNSAKIIDYGYDALNRLTTASTTDAVIGNYSRTYDYDALGNITNASDLGNYTYSGAGYTNPHAVTDIAGRPYVYDNDGNLTHDGTWTHSWDYQNRLISSTNNGGATTTVSFYPAAGDGAIQATRESWNAAHEALNGNEALPSDATFYVRTGKPGAATYRIERSFLPFDTSSLPDNAIVIDAKLKVFVGDKLNNDNDGSDFVTVVQATQPSTSTLTTADYDLAGSINNPTEGINASERKDITSVNTGHYLTFNLNATGRSWVTATSSTKLALREGHDVVDEPFTGTSGQYNSLTIRAGEYDGTAADPVLEVAYATTTLVTANFAYDHEGQRVKYQTATSTTVYPSKYFNTDGANPVRHIFSPHGDLVATITGSSTASTTQFIHTDHLTGSNVATNASGAIVELMDYYPYGSSRIDSGSYSEQRKFAGHEYDSAIGLNYMGARYYNPGVGRFLSQDPVFLSMGNEQEIKSQTNRKLQELLTDPQSLNSYAYARNNPLRLVDPSGEWFWDVVSGKQSWDSFATEVGQAAQYLYDNSSAWRTAQDHPYATAGAVGVAGGLGAAGGAAGLSALSNAYLGGAGTACLALCGQSDKAMKLLNNTQKILTDTQRTSISEAIENPKLQSLFSRLYQANDQLPGGTAGAIKYEKETGILLSRAGHLQKGTDAINTINKVLKGPNLSSGDRSIAQTILTQLQRAIKGGE